MFSKTTLLLWFTLFCESASQAKECVNDEHRLYAFEENFKILWEDIEEFIETNEVNVRSTEKDRVAYIFGETDKVKIFAHSP